MGLLCRIHFFFNVCSGCYVTLVAHGCKAHTGLPPSFVYITFWRVLQGCPFSFFLSFLLLNLTEVGAFEKAKRPGLVFYGEVSSLSPGY